MRERGLEFKVGLLILVSSASLVSFIVILGNFSLRSGFTIYVDYDYVGTLSPGAPVKLSGIKEAYCQVLEHKWYLSERAGHDVGHDAATYDLLAQAAAE